MIHGNQLFPTVEEFQPSCSVTKCNNVVVSFSGGRTSAFMAKKMKESPYWSAKKLLFVFANTGKENEATLRFVDECDRQFGLSVVWVEAAVNPERGAGTKFKVVTFESAARNGEPFESMIQKYGIPNRNFPQCTRELKDRPISAYAKTIFGRDYVTALGMRFDEIRRVKIGDIDRVYPLVGAFVTVRDVRDFWNNQPFDLQLRDYEGNCDLCWKKSLRKKLTLLKEKPSLADWWHEMEQKYARADIHNNGVVAHFNRDNQSVQELLEMSQKPFVPVTDPFWKQNESDEMDSEQSCICGNATD